MNMIKTFLTLLLLSGCVYSMGANIDRGTQTIRVDSTELATLSNTVDILSQIPGLSSDNGKIYVDGRGVAEIYIDDRKLTELTELWHTPANRVSAIDVITSPGAQYDKTVRAVIIIRLKAVTDNGFTLDNDLRFDYTHRLSTSDELSLAWKYDKLNAGFSAGWNQGREEDLEKDYETTYKDGVPTGAIMDLSYPYIHSQQVTLKGNFGYDFSPLHHLEASYSFIRRPRNSALIGTGIHYDYPVHDGVVDFANPSGVSEAVGARQTAPMTRHMVNLEYRGYINRWTLKAGTNVTFEDMDTNIYIDGGGGTDYLRDEIITRSYVKASLPVGEGSFDAGIEYNTDGMEVQYARHFIDPSRDQYNYTHTDVTDNTLAAYVNLSQTFGIWTLAGGVRYEGNFYAYKPYSDDAVMDYLDHIMPGLIKVSGINPRDYLFGRLWLDRKYKEQSHNIYPSISISAELGKSTLTLSHSISYNKAYLGLSRITLMDIDPEAMLSKMLDDEKITTNVLDWRWQWLDLSLTHNRHDHPVFNGLSSLIAFNGDSYDDLDLKVSASPTIGWWHPSLVLTFHKQWLDLKGAESHLLRKPHLAISWTNSLNLPANWLVLLNADWHSRGAQRNTYYYSTNFVMDAAVQKSFPRQHLTLKLQLSNIFRDSYDDVTIVTQDATSAAGYAIRLPRSLSLSLRYNF